MADIIVALSGGLDSSLAAVLLHQKKYSIVGVHMLLPRAEDAKGADEVGRRDYLYAQSICKSLNIPFHVIDFKEAFREKVIGYLKNEYIRGRTPNPCIVCNREIKFGLLHDFAREQGIHLIATGHYARVEPSDPYGRFYLKKSAAKERDQTYFLSMLKQPQLGDALFPLGEYTEKEIEALAEQYRIKDRDRPSSQDICFIASDYRDLFTESRGRGPGYKSGPIRDMSGKKVGKHKGIARYTIGQRKGIGAHSEPMYVTEIHPETNTVVIGKDEDLYSSTFIVEDVNWVKYFCLENEYTCCVRVRYRDRPSRALVTPLEYKKIQVTFNKPKRAITPGQVAVLYQGEYVIGAGWIANSSRRAAESTENV